MPSSVDLHTHTTASDGTLAPLALLEKAVSLSLRYLAISDHDSTAGYEAVLATAAQYPDLRLIAAIELNADAEAPCHILGYFIEVGHVDLQNRLKQYRESRVGRLQAMTQKMNALGFPVDFNRVVELAQGGALGRPHLADALRERGHVKSRKEAFDRFLKRGGPAYEKGEGPAPQEAIQLIRRAGGVPVLAHPSYYTTDQQIEHLVGMGLMGIEAYYPEHSRSLIKRYLEMARTFGLVATGGSDYHGPRTGRTELACVDVPVDVIGNLSRAKETL